MLALAFMLATIDFPFDDGKFLDKGESLGGRAVVMSHEEGRKLPLIVFLHGNNAGGIPHMWLNETKGFDLRPTLRSIVTKSSLGPFVFAAPSQTHDAAKGVTLWRGFDLHAFVDGVKAATGATIDEGRVYVIGHSGAGCNPDGGILGIPRGTFQPRAVIAIDVCMDDVVARSLGSLLPQVDVWSMAQTKSWPRDVAQFEKLVLSARAGAATRIELVDARTWNNPHDDIVVPMLERILPEIIL